MRYFREIISYDSGLIVRGAYLSVEAASAFPQHASPLLNLAGSMFRFLRGYFSAIWRSTSVPPIRFICKSAAKGHRAG